MAKGDKTLMSRLWILIASLVAVAALAVEIKVGTGSNINVSIIGGGPWIDSMVPGSAFRNGASAPGLSNFTDSDIQVLSFAKAADNLVHGSFQLNHNYKEGTDIKLHLHVFFPTAAAGETETNVWRVCYSWANIGDVFPAATVVNVTNTGAITQYEHRMINVGTLTGSGKTISSVVALSVQRTGTDGHDIYDDYIGFLGADAHYQVDALGSTTDSNK